MLRPGSSEPDWIVVRRFEQLCAFLGRHKRDYTVRGLGVDQPQPALGLPIAIRPRASLTSTAWRHMEQIKRRLADKIRRP
jgi:hypothetical protein